MALPVLALVGAMFVLAGCGSNSGTSAESPPAVDTRTAASSGASMGLSFQGAEQVSQSDLQLVQSNSAAQAYLLGKPEQAGAKAKVSTGSVSDYVTVLPHKTKPPVPLNEQHLLKAYLEHPNDGGLASFIALVHLNKSLLNKSLRTSKGERLKYTILANYFLSRAKELGKTEGWVLSLLGQTQREIDKLLEKARPVTSEEDHFAHRYFNETFNYHEENRYKALEVLLDDFADKPGNVYTAFAINAANLWIGGEGDYDDPTVLHNFVLGSFFSIHTMQLAKELEVAWLADRTSTPRFRMASILGGFSALHRRWLAKLHGQQEAVDAIDNEHRKWRVIQRAFHGFTVGLSFFEEKQNFMEGIVAWGEGFCQDIPGLRTCSNNARFAYGAPGYMLGYVDYLLKAGDTGTATQILQLRHLTEQYPFMKAYAQWDLGRGPWEHREQHMNEIAALYGNDNPADDPMNFFLQKRKWGASTSTCQSCHQAQSTTFTEEEKNTVQLPPEAVATVGDWPVVSTTWYGSVLNVASN